MFKPAPKAQVSVKFRELFGADVAHEVRGLRLDPRVAKRMGFPSDTFYAELLVEGEVLASARSRDWRKAYKLLKLEVEKLYADGGLLEMVD